MQGMGSNPNPRISLFYDPIIKNELVFSYRLIFYFFRQTSNSYSIQNLYIAKKKIYYLEKYDIIDL